MRTRVTITVAGFVAAALWTLPAPVVLVLAVVWVFCDVLVATSDAVPENRTPTPGWVTEWFPRVPVHVVPAPGVVAYSTRGGITVSEVVLYSPYAVPVLSHEAAHWMLRHHSAMARLLLLPPLAAVVAALTVETLALPVTLGWFIPFVLVWLVAVSLRSKRNEFAADRFAARVCGPERVASMLEAFLAPSDGGGLFCSHPSRADRLTAVTSVVGE